MARWFQGLTGGERAPVSEDRSCRFLSRDQPTCATVALRPLIPTERLYRSWRIGASHGPALVGPNGMDGRGVLGSPDNAHGRTDD